MFEVLQNFFLLFVLSGGLSKDIETILQTICFYFTQSFLKKQKQVQMQSPCLIFFMPFGEKYFSCYILLIDQISLPRFLQLLKYWPMCVLQLFVNQVVTSKIWKLSLYFLSSRLFYFTKKSRQKFRYLENKKRF